MHTHTFHLINNLSKTEFKANIYSQKTKEKTLKTSDPTTRINAHILNFKNFNCKRQIKIAVDTLNVIKQWFSKWDGFPFGNIW